MLQRLPALPLRDNDGGAVAVIVAIMAVLLFGMAAFAVDMGIAYASKREQSVTADASALAGAQAAGTKFQELYPSGAACTTAVATSLTNAATDAATAVYNAQRPNSSADPDVTVQCDGADAIDVVVESTATFDTVFGQLFNVKELKPAAAATARVSGAKAYGGLRPFAVCDDDIVRGDQTLTQQSLYLNSVVQTKSGDWGYALDTAMTEPVVGNVRLSADNTQMAVSGSEFGGKKFTSLKDVAGGYTVEMQQITDPSKWGRWSVVQSASNSSWYLLDLTLESDAADLPSKGSGVTLKFTENKKPGVTCGPLGSGNWGIVDFDGGSNPNTEIALWTEFGYNAAVQIPDPAMPGNPGVDTSAPVKNALDSIIGDVVLLPAASKWNEGGGNPASFVMESVIAVQICGYQDGKKSPVVKNSDGTAPGCWDDALADPALNPDPAVAEADFKLQWQWRPFAASYLPGGSVVECKLSDTTKVCLPAIRLYR